VWDVRTLVDNKKLPLYFVKTTPHIQPLGILQKNIVDVVEKIIAYFHINVIVTSLCSNYNAKAHWN